MRRARRVVAAGLLVIGGGLVGGCSEESSSPESDPGDTATATLPPITLDPGFYTWQQRRTYTGEKAKIATTVHAADYYAEIPQRPHGGLAPELEQVTTDSMYSVIIGGVGPDTYPKGRGPVTTRLMSIELNGKTAVAVWCVDDSAKEVRTEPDEPWTGYRGSGYFPATRRYVRSNSSPTGWREGETIHTRLTPQQCQQTFQDGEPAVTTTGPPDLPDRS